MRKQQNKVSQLSGWAEFSIGVRNNEGLFVFEAEVWLRLHVLTNEVDLSPAFRRVLRGFFWTAQLLR